MKILVLTNILTPYRMALFGEIEQQLRAMHGSITIAAMSETEPDRPWSYSDLRTEATVLLQGTTATIAGTYTHITRGLREVFQRASPDVVICAGSYLAPAVWQALWIQRTTSKPFLTFFWSESHLSEQTRRSLPTRTIREFARKATYPHFDGFLSPGTLADQFIEKYSRHCDHIIRFPNTIDDRFYNREHLRLRTRRDELRRKYGIDQAKFAFVTPARLTRVKGVDKMLELASDMARRRNSLFIVAGSGEQAGTLSALARTYDVDLRLLGQRTQDEMAELYALADCFLLPSVSDPNPLTVLEALWSGLPLLLSSHVGNHPEAVIEGKNGYVFSYDDPAAATKTFDLVVDSQATWRAMARTESRRIAQQQFQSREVVRDLLLGLSDRLGGP